ncbi:RNA polymerase subunit sigma-24 [Prauserella sp. PE36]|uniref:Sigma-70 family RNA polymerase sigma factor n=1 Tax=Prauserella endophytica TaxID=1592324 RepID=A0ABY2S428_9PSEU|nr:MULTISPECIES: RNA polymerase sigma factor SigJ [Prauserella]PXY33022.1 RNA polymerase subunit sigma-24 [Prauserella coralliicola]RBM16422.1 RNA polymerase subunit sigma-24 [Prauserella sp. PE36]TKG69563.1 sigma-70 family RNA polymerase sigma factor [Prauserella endophytica]
MTDPATQTFLDHRELLFSVVYNLLGTVSDTEDVLQETWLAWAPRARSGEPVANPRAYLVRIAVNQALGSRAAINRRRETYVGQWLPEPLVEGESDPVERAESTSMALLVVLETLSPLERAVFVLHEVFGYAHTETAEILGRSPSAVRQLAHRAREHMHARRPRYRPDPAIRREVTERFLAAALGGELEALLEVLAPDVTLWTDGGGKGPARSLSPVHGRDAVARLFVAVAAHAPPAMDVRYRRVNGDPSAVLFDGDAPFAVFVLDLSPDGDRVAAIYSVTNPDKLSGVR